MKRNKLLTMGIIFLCGSLFVGSIYKITNVRAYQSNWRGYIYDWTTHQPIEGAECTLKFGLYTYPPTYEWGNSYTTGSNGYYTIVDSLPDNWGSTHIKVEVDGYVIKTTEIIDPVNSEGGIFNVYMRAYF